MIKVFCDALNWRAWGGAERVVAMIVLRTSGEGAVPSAYGHRRRADAHRYFEKIYRKRWK